MSKDVKVVCNLTLSHIESLTWDVANEIGDIEYEDFTVGTEDLKGFIAILQAILDARGKVMVCATCLRNPCVCPDSEEGDE